MRAFFGLSVDAPWPISYPKGRILPEESRHVTLLFLENQTLPPLDTLPTFSTILSPVGLMDERLFLPEEKERVVADRVRWLSQEKEVLGLRKHLCERFERPLCGDFLPHVSLARSPFPKDDWAKAFEKLPLKATGLCLYKSLGNLQYEKIWEHRFIEAFEEFEHTADIAFYVRGKSFSELYLHGAIALAFKHPPFLEYIEQKELSDLQGVVRALNEMVHACDRDVGCPVKAVSHHGKAGKRENLYHWEMVVDV